MIFAQSVLLTSECGNLPNKNGIITCPKFNFSRALVNGWAYVILLFFLLLVNVVIANSKKCIKFANIVYLVHLYSTITILGNFFFAWFVTGQVFVYHTNICRLGELDEAPENGTPCCVKELLDYQKYQFYIIYGLLGLMTVLFWSFCFFGACIMFNEGSTVKSEATSSNLSSEVEATTPSDLSLVDICIEPDQRHLESASQVKENKQFPHGALIYFSILCL